MKTTNLKKILKLMEEKYPDDTQWKFVGLLIFGDESGRITYNTLSPYESIAEFNFSTIAELVKHLTEDEK